jgi:hypothetical protein
MIRHVFLPLREPSPVSPLPVSVIQTPLAALLVSAPCISEIATALDVPAPTRAEDMAPIAARTEEKQLPAFAPGALDNS